MDLEEMEARREAALRHLEETIQEIGPVAEQTPGLVREPLLEAIKKADEAGEEIRNIKFGNGTMMVGRVVCKR